MEHQEGNSSKPSSPGFSLLQSSESTVHIHNNNLWSGPQVNIDEDGSIAKGPQKGNFEPYPMSKEEAKIRGELECEVEKDLEEEIKDGICRLALRLHRLYQHQKERVARCSSMNGVEIQTETRNVPLTEVSIVIRMEGESRIEVSESNKEIFEKNRTGRNVKLENNKANVGPSSKEFDWVRTLRSGSSSVAINKKNNASNRDRAVKNGHDMYRKGRNFSNSSDQEKRKALTKDTKLLQLGWRS